jgi:dolichyl-phosphate-mannose--protein O-mannosyl transferase
MAIAMFLVLAWFVRTRELPYLWVWVGLICGWFPWIFTYERTQFAFYAIVFEAFMVIGLMAVFVKWSHSGANSRRNIILLAGFTVVVLAISVYFFPMWTGQPISEDFMRDHFWLPSWA